MDNEEFNKLCEELRAQGMDDEDILGTLLEMFKKGEVDVDDMSKMAGSLGYELTDEFLAEAAPAPESPAEGGPSEDEGEKPSEEQIEDAQEVDSGEGEAEPESDEDKPEQDEEDEKEEARKLFNLD